MIYLRTVLLCRGVPFLLPAIIETLSPENQIHSRLDLTEKEGTDGLGHKSGDHGDSASEKAEDTIFHQNTSFLKVHIQRGILFLSPPRWNGNGDRNKGGK